MLPAMVVIIAIALGAGGMRRMNRSTEAAVTSQIQAPTPAVSGEQA
jgi:Tfp pilus assembly protein PilV